jgi:histidine triad (HIT) family protein
MADCLFCRIVQKEIPAQIVHETDSTLAFRDVNPQAPVHVLVIPKEHVQSLMHWEPKHAALIGQIHETIRKVAESEQLAGGGFRMVVNNGRDAGQAVHHIHYHVLAGRKLGWPPG